MPDIAHPPQRSLPGADVAWARACAGGSGRPYPLLAMEPSAAEIRVLGCLIEKQRTTPDAYPLTLNALRQACNQSTGRTPVLDLDEAEIRAALDRLSRRRWARLASGPGSRAPKYRHLLADALGLGDDDLSVLAVLMLRGPQTPGELKARAARLHAFPDLGSVDATLERLVERGHARQLERRPGQKEERYAHVLGAGASTEPSSREQEGGDVREERSPAPAAAPSARIARLEREVAALRDAVEGLERRLRS
jgi:uncharacterized protein YceH (UPF0502 family)